MDKNGIIVLFSPIVLGMVSGLLVPKNKIPTVKSKWNPPSFVFSIVWPILYLILGYSSYKIYKIAKTKGFDEPAKTYLILFYIHLACLIIWWPLFVFFPNKTLSLVSILALAFSAMYIARVFFEMDKTAGLILTPYIMWLFVASFLTANT